MRPSYIILTDSGERLYLDGAQQFSAYEYEWQAGRFGFWFDPEQPNDSYCYEPIFDPDFDGDLGECIQARTIPFRAFDAAGHLICQDNGGVCFWL